MDSIDIIAQGSKTFLQIISFIEKGIVPDLPYKGKHLYAFTHTPLNTTRTDVTFVLSMQEFLSIISQDPTIKKIWLLGGAELIQSFKEYDLIDECIITVIPITLHKGIALPKNIFSGMKKIQSKKLFNEIIEEQYIKE